MATAATAAEHQKKVATTYNYTLAQVRVTNLNAGSVVALRWRAARLRHHGRTDAVTVGLNGIAAFTVGTVAFPVALRPAAGVADEWAPRTVRFSLLEMPATADHHDYGAPDDDAAPVADDIVDAEDDEEEEAPQKEKQQPQQQKRPGLLARWRERRAAREVARCTLQLAYFADAAAKPVVVEMERVDGHRGHRPAGTVSPLMVSVNPLLAVTVTAHPKGAAAEQSAAEAQQREE